MNPDLPRILAEYVAAHAGPDAVSSTPVDGVTVMCSTQSRMPFRQLYKPSLCIVAQGAKRIELADRTLDYCAGMGLAVSIDLPGFGSVTKASAAMPFLGLTIEIDTAMLRDILGKLGTPPPTTPDRIGAFVETFSAAQQDCIARLVRLFATPEAVPVLYPAIMQEFYFWLLTGPNGDELVKIVSPESHTRRIAAAIFLLRREYRRPIRVEELAVAAGMSESTFHERFKTLTSVTPLQYQKQLRLMEARRLMVVENINVTQAAFNVGYESPTQFSREYSRLFGAPPRQNARSLKWMGALPSA